MGWFTRKKVPKHPLAVSAVILDRGFLAELDEARDYNAASSYNFLNAELKGLGDFVEAGGIVIVESESERLVLTGARELIGWVRKRYPGADLAKRSA